MTGPGGPRITDGGFSVPPDSKRDPATADAVLRPFRGPFRFRRHASLRVDHGQLIVSGARGELKRFSLTDDGKPYAFADTLDDIAIVDRDGRAVVVTSRTCWDGDEAKKFAAASGLWSYLGSDSDTTPLRADGFRLRTSRVLEASNRWALPVACAVLGAVRVLWGGYGRSYPGWEEAVLWIGIAILCVLFGLAVWSGRTGQRHHLEIVDGTMVIRNERGELVDRIPLSQAHHLELGMELEGVFALDVVDAAGTPVDPNATDIHLEEGDLLDLAEKTHLPLVIDPEKDPFLAADKALAGLDPTELPLPAADKATATLEHPNDEAERRLSIRVENNLLIIADHRKEIGRYRIDGTSGSPAAMVEICGRIKTEDALVDGEGRALLIFPGDFWSRYDILRFATAAKLAFEIRDGRWRAHRLELAPGGVRYGGPTADWAA